METPSWHGFAVYAGRVRLGTLEQVWRASGDAVAVIAVRSAFPGVPRIMVRLTDLAEIRPTGRRIEVGDKPEIVFDALKSASRDRNDRHI
jgi:hypothetical protein